MRQLNWQNRRPIRVVLDTNVLISAMLFRKQLGIFYDLINDKFITPYFIETTFCELQNLIQSNKFKPALEKILLSPEDIINAIGDKSVVLPNPANIPKIINDTPDNFILACAIFARANFIISGDKHLLKLKSFQNIPILTPRQFLNLVNLEWKLGSPS